jgi:HEAT repeat protein
VFSGASETAVRLAAHGAPEMAVHAAAAAADLLNAARLLAGTPLEGSFIGERLMHGGSTTVHLRDRAAATSALLGDLELVYVEDPVAPDDVAAAPASGPLPAPPIPEHAAGGGLFDHFAAVRPADGCEALLAELRTAADRAVPELLGRVTLAADQAQRVGDGASLVALVAGVQDRESNAGDAVRRDCALALRRMLSSHALRMIAALVPRRTIPLEAVAQVLMRAGDDGADAVIELLTQAQTAPDRRAYFNMLLTLRAGVPTLLHMLGDDRWYVVRNAVDLLGELGATEAERAITALLHHADERVRQSAATALLRFDTPAGRAAILAAVQSESPATRQQAVLALGTRKDAGTASMLLHALDREHDDAVQRSIYTALGKVATPDAVQRLVDAASPANGLFRRKSPTLRAAAALALGDTRSPAAIDALRLLAGDKEPAVRDAALRALSNARRGNEPRVTGLFEAIREP